MGGMVNFNYFWNLVFVTGALLVVAGCFASKRPVTIIVKGNTLSFGPISRIAMLQAYVAGVILVVLSMVIFALTNWAGLVSPLTPDAKKENATAGPTTGNLSLSLVPVALAAGGEALVAEITVPNEHLRTVDPHFKGRVAIYVGRIHLTGAARIVVFSPTRPWSENDHVPYDEFRKRVVGEPILAEGEVSDGGSLAFTYGGRPYLVTAKLAWFLVGKNYAELRVFVR